MQNELQKSLKRIVDYFGNDAQKVKAIEELTELVVEIAKDLNGQSDNAKLVDELADARIMFSQLIIMYKDLVPEIEKRVAFKINRTMNYISQKIAEEEIIDD